MVQYCPLPFGNSESVLHLDPESAAESMYATLPTLHAFSTNSEQSFISRTSQITVGATSLVAHSTSPCRLEIEQSDGWHIVIPYTGSGTIKSENRVHHIKAGSNAALFPNARRMVDRHLGSTAIISINIDLINTIFRSLSKNDKSFIHLTESCLLNLSRGNGGYRTFAAICNLIDSQFHNPMALQVLGVEDLIHRWIASCLLLGEVELPCGPDVTRIDIVCDHIRSSIDRPLTLTEMERVSCLSARALQYAFKARFGCSPMEWQRNERLLGARQRLLSMGSGESITSVAHSMGFSSSSAFSALYKQKFGETPSETITRRS